MAPPLTGRYTQWTTLHWRRRRADLTIPQLAAEVRYSPSHLYEVEAGSTACGPILNDRLAARFGMDPRELERTQPVVPPKPSVTRKPRPATEVA